MKKLFNKDNLDFATGIICLTVVSVGAMLILKYFTDKNARKRPILIR